MKKFFNWISETLIFKGLLLSTVLICMVILMGVILIVIHSLFYSDFSPLREAYINFCENFSKLISIWLAFSILMCYAIVVD